MFGATPDLQSLSKLIWIERCSSSRAAADFVPDCNRAIPLGSLPSGPMNQVTIHNIDIPFGRLVAIIFKFMLASIPAVLLLYLVMGVIGAIFLLLFGGLIGGAGFLESLNTDSLLPENTAPAGESSPENGLFP